MRRRDALKLIGGSLMLPNVALGGERPEITYYGASPPAITPHRKTFHQVYRPLKGASDGKNVFLWEHLERELGGRLVPHYQGPAEDGSPGEGDCVAQAGALGADILAGVNIHMLGLQEKFVAKASVEMSYAGGRVEIGKNAITRRAGSHGEWQARFFKEYGVLHRIKYSDGTNELDLSGYHPDRSREYRDTGVPDWLEKYAKEHPVKEITQVKSGREAMDAMAAGQPVLICSSYAIERTRDADGFSRPLLGFTRNGWRWGRPQWWHCMLGIGCIHSPRPGAAIANSHGIWNEGPQPNGLPDGAFFIEEQYLDLMIKDWLDCWALGSYYGHQAKAIKHKLY